MNSAGHTSVKTWARFNTTRKIYFKERRRKKKTKSKLWFQSPCAQVNAFELSAQIIFLLNHAGSVCPTCIYLLFLPPAGTEPDSWVDPRKHGALQTPLSWWPRGCPRSVLVLPGFGLHQSSVGSRCEGPETNRLTAKSSLLP